MFQEKEKKKVRLHWLNFLHAEHTRLVLTTVLLCFVKIAALEKNQESTAKVSVLFTDMNVRRCVRAFKIMLEIRS